MSAAPWGTSALLLLGSGLLVQVIAERWLKDRWLIRFLWGCLAGRAALSVALYLASAHHWPILSGLQLGEGFWRFAPDAVGHHQEYLKIIDAWQQGFDPYVTGHRGLHFFFLPRLYWLLGAHPLHGILLNATLGAASALVAAGIVRQLGGSRRATRIAAIFVGLWPSLIWWATQLLKEQLVVFLALLALLAIIGLAEVATRPVPARGMALIRWGMWALFTNFLLAATRPDYAVALALAATLGFGVWGLRQLLARRRLRTACALGCVAVLMGQMVVWGKQVRPFGWWFPTQAIKHFDDGEMYRTFRNDPARAEVAFRAAIRSDPRFQPTYYQLLAIFETDGRINAIKERFGPEWQAAGSSKRFVTLLRRAHRLDELAAALPPMTEPASASLVQVMASSPKELPAPLPPMPEVATLDLAEVQAAQQQAARVKANLPSRKRWWSGLVSRVRVIPSKITSIRNGQRVARGHSTLDPNADLSSFSKIIAYLPKGLSYVFLAPFPWQAVDARGGTGVMKGFSLVEVFLVYGLIPFGLAGSWRIIRENSLSGWVLLIYLAAGSVILALTMTNLGTLFRLRVAFLLAFSIMASLELPNAIRLLSLLMSSRRWKEGEVVGWGQGGAG